VDTRVAESPRISFQDHSSGAKLPRRDALWTSRRKLLFPPPVAAKRTRAHPMWRTGRQKELTSTAAFSGPFRPTASALCTF
uniref:Uncharacterized protein n=1 Tax=Gasterosteus aculeatus TaxID=69293 RepID=G3NYZ0_GASAC